MPTNPADQLMSHERPKAGQARKRFLSRDEMRALLDASPPALSAAHQRRAVRRSAALGDLGLIWADVDFAGDQCASGFRWDATANGDA